ncbi:hypothetical protein L618_002200000500 [Rhodococcus rhodochrous J45]|uniref:Uncharacterized protein n=2 Tax=Rhodococcus rhodochrous TaxID=1829 RepID=A0A562E480_RHORH|nr:hypothetical protein L618_002200000500 [Rhodococcus rhodochrous J45]
MPPMDPIPRLSAPHALMRHMIDTPDFDTAAAAARIRKNAPEPLQEHWADIDGVLYPPKQAYHLISGQPRSEFNTHHALTQLRKCGFATSVYVPRSASDTEPAGDGPADSVETIDQSGPATTTTPGTWRVSDGSAVSFRDAISEWGAVAHDVLLETASRYNDFVTYKELAEKVQEISGIRTKSQMRNWIGKVLAVVVEECARRGEPPLTSLCVTQNQTVGDGYRFVLETAGESIPDDLDHHAAEARLKCYRAYSTDLPSNGGTPTLPPQVTASREAAARKAAAARPEIVELCPEHHTVLPRSGRCDYCA